MRRGRWIEALLNRTARGATASISARAEALHRASFVADLHADSLLWSRDLRLRSNVGHVDLARLRDGNVALQVFTAVTQIPFGINLHRTDERWPDLITLLGALHRWPESTRSSRLARALFQVQALERVCAADGGMTLIRARGDLDALLSRRRSDPRRIGALAGVEGAHALDGEPANLTTLYAHGIRLVGLAHFFDNEFAGSAHGRHKGGLTEKGRALVREMERLGVIVDLAHSSEQTFEDALSTVRLPPIVSHTGVRGVCPNPRNLSDDEIHGVAGAGGLIGIGFWRTAVGGTTAADVVRSIRYVIDLVGDRHVALGSDFDGAVKVPFDCGHLVQVTQALVDDGLSDASIRRVLGENVIRVLREVLPER